MSPFKFNLSQSVPQFSAYDNSIDPFIPQLWAEESLAILEENMVVAQLVHRK